MSGLKPKYPSVQVNINAFSMSIHELNGPIQRERLALIQKQSRRKFSFPATLHSASLLEISPTSTRRRLSNVSDVVTRKLSYTIGWKAAQISSQEIITQGKCLCGQYIKRRLRRSGLFNKKLGLQRIRSILGTSSISVVREVFPALMILGDNIERMHPRVYTGIARQICRSPSGDFSSSETVGILLTAVARELFRIEITWGKIISLFAVAGGLAVDCVRQGHLDYLPKLVDAVSDVIEDDLVSWINENGGWSGLNLHVHSTSSEFYLLERTTYLVGCVFSLFVVIIIIRFFGCYLLPMKYSGTGR
ncbi:bcl-2-related ovarian killer protein homolog A-like isoform X2 [Episyrphus balteatus]|uniref:bcl-2-related ovarian killer protein homolog A-like isoform X2 n=1 Tax=Episyrphus balteatus TaxID=286459 RepID=UPI0024852F69|nr:bcl-2-related ovarian killer protein homolog A-like isoform X2 [Episyrphus balteatus]